MYNRKPIVLRKILGLSTIMNLWINLDKLFFQIYILIKIRVYNVCLFVCFLYTNKRFLQNNVLYWEIFHKTNLWILKFLENTTKQFHIWKIVFRKPLTKECYHWCLILHWHLLHMVFVYKANASLWWLELSGWWGMWKHPWIAQQPSKIYCMTWQDQQWNLSWIN